MLLSLSPSPCSYCIHKYWTCCENDNPHKLNELTTRGKLASQSFTLPRLLQHSSICICFLHHRIKEIESQDSGKESFIIYKSTYWRNIKMKLVSYPLWGNVHRVNICVRRSALIVQCLRRGTIFFLTILYSAVMKLKILHQFKQLGQVHSDNFCQLTNPHSCNRLPILGIFHEQRGLPPSASSLLFCLITSAHLTSKLLSLGTSPYLPVNLNIQCR